MRRLLVLGLAATALAGCGGDSARDAAAVRRAVTGFLTALGAGDGRAACALVTPAGRDTLATEAGRRGAPCESAVAASSRRLPPSLRLALRTVSVGRVELDGERATVRDDQIRSRAGSLEAVLSAGGATRLVKTDGGWRLTG